MGCDDRFVDYNDSFQVTIVRARYGGVYEPGRWLAFNTHPAALPAEWDADDLTASAYFDEHAQEVGGGDTPDEAYQSLRAIVRRRRDSE